MTRKQTLAAMKAAGAANDKATFTRLFIENRISRAVADQAWRDGAALRRFCDARDAAPETP